MNKAYYNEKVNYKKKSISENEKKLIYIVLALISLVFVILISIKTGSIKIGFLELISGLFSSKTTGDIGIIKDLRLPRILIAVFVGMNLAISGVFLQAVMRNPLADPGITGISSGASLIAIIVIVFFPQLNVFKSIFSFVGGLIAAILVYSIAYNKRFTPIRIVLAGICINSLLSSLASIITMINSSGSNSIQMWLSGNLAAVSWEDVKILAIYTAIGIIMTIPLYKTCNLIVLGDKISKSLGIDTDKQSIVISAVAVFLASISTGVAGIISFVGLVVPHMSRFIIGSDHKYLIPFSGIMGSILLLLADTLGRSLLKPYEIPVGLVMSIIGVPFFIYLLRRGESKC